MGLWTYEREQWKNGVQTVCGVDEAGAGPLMGPVYAAAVILPREADIPGLNDSKKLTEKKREALYEIIKPRRMKMNREILPHMEAMTHHQTAGKKK